MHRSKLWSLLLHWIEVRRQSLRNKCVQPLNQNRENVYTFRWFRANPMVFSSLGGYWVRLLFLVCVANFPLCIFRQRQNVYDLPPNEIYPERTTDVFLFYYHHNISNTIIVYELTIVGCRKFALCYFLCARLILSKIGLLLLLLVSTKTCELRIESKVKNRSAACSFLFSAACPGHTNQNTHAHIEI